MDGGASRKTIVTRRLVNGTWRREQQFRMLRRAPKLPPELELRVGPGTTGGRWKLGGAKCKQVRSPFIFPLSFLLSDKSGVLAQYSTVGSRQSPMEESLQVLSSVTSRHYFILSWKEKLPHSQ